MSSKTQEKKLQDFKIPPAERFDIKDCIIPFSLFYPKPIYIYSGEEKIPFKDRLPEYRAILLQEFEGFLRKED